ncbi:S-glutathionyl-(chloro)hydroquinone reductase [Physocladia obscura]|uniref:S-glutathionyl-(Chloro)hydroquinone reductase n=1 Tax=Physocladia obscura TaxID=109957 RepID=A0AAD5SSM3_9FUNG|nr:S-glutathionyl-(chloro)hydroquinone reductase [Physocladia obscura]
MTTITPLIDADGEFRRPVSSFRDFITQTGQFTPDKDRYHLYISLAWFVLVLRFDCSPHLLIADWLYFSSPWAHRTLIVRNLKGLEDVIGLSIVDYHLTKVGWHFSEPEKTPGTIPDTINNARFIKEIYYKANKDFVGRFTVPVLWDKKEQTIVNNESSEIIRMLNNEFNAFSDNVKLDLYPTLLRPEIDSINEWIYDQINNGVYKTGFATTQEAYEKNVKVLFDGLDRVETQFATGNKRYLVGNQFTEADVRLFTTIVRFDPIYHGHFKCNIKTISHDYPHILKWLRRIYQHPKVSATVNWTHIKGGYYGSQLNINPTAIIAAWNGPILDFPIIAEEDGKNLE